MADVKALVAELREKLAKATEGPWEIVEDCVPGYDEAWCEWHKVGPKEHTGKEADNNDRFIVFARNNLPTLLGHIESLEADKERLTVERDNLHHFARNARAIALKWPGTPASDAILHHCELVGVVGSILRSGVVGTGDSDE